MASTPHPRLNQLQATFPLLDEWGEALAVAHRPEPGSRLATDDEDWPPVPVTQVAVMGLGAARDHLHAVRVLIEARQLFPYAQSTLIRSALIGAAQAVWVLAPEDAALRIERARLLADHMYGQQVKYLNVLRQLAPEPHEGTELVAAHVAQRSAELREIRSAAGQRAQLNTTDMVRGATLVAFNDGALALEAVSIWQATSGAAHGSAWSVLGQPDTEMTGTPDDAKLAEFGAAGGIDRIANPYLCAFHLARKGWDLLHRRSVADAADGASLPSPHG